MLRQLLFQVRSHFGSWRTLHLHYRTKTYQSKALLKEKTTTVVHTGKLERDILLYTHSDARHFKIVLACIAGASVFFFITGDSFRVVGNSLRQKRYSSLESETEETRSRNWAVRLWKFKDGTFHTIFSALFMTVGCFCLFTALYAPVRYIRSIVLLKGGNKVCLSTYAPFGSTKHLVYNVDQVYSKYPLIEGKPNFISVPKRWMPFYLNSTGGVFSNKEELKRVLRQSTAVK